MKPDKLDIKIREAAAQNEPAFTEEAWDTMEKLLDKKMPVKKRDKRKIVWLFIFLFILSGGIFLIMKSWENKTDSNIAVKSDKANPAVASRNNIVKPKMNTVKESLRKSPEPAPALKISNVGQSNHSGTNNQNHSPDVLDKRSSVNDGKTFYSSRNETGIPAKQDQQNSGQIKNNESDHQGGESIAENPKPNDSISVIKKNHTDSMDSLIVKREEQNMAPKEKTSAKSGNHFINSLAFQFSIGPDVSFTSLENIGKVRPVYGVGVSYSVNKKITVRTGFYVARKVYDAQPSEYNPPPGFWNYYPDLKQIDADCKIYEVPIGVNYYFRQTSKHQWYGTMGLSSYFMKKEVYDYYSKNTNGQTWNSTYSIQNKNQHFFSSLRLGAGYEKKTEKNISIIAEPYLNIPLYGIGYGKVKLYSAGVIFTLKVKPFSKK